MTYTQTCDSIHSPSLKRKSRQSLKVFVPA